MAKNKTKVTTINEQTQGLKAESQAVTGYSEEQESFMVSQGHRVNFVMLDGQLRPFDVVRVWPGNMINGHLLIDGDNDQDNIPNVSEEWELPRIIQTQSPHTSIPITHLWLTGVQYSESLTPGTWHMAEEETEEETAEAILAEAASTNKTDTPTT